MDKLFKSFDLAGIKLKNRVVMAPMTRAKAMNDIADELTALYYTQRATAGLIISEGTPISRQGQGYLFNPGIYTKEQIDGWRITTNSVHAVGGKIFAQLWHVGRISHPSIQGEGTSPVSASSQGADDVVYGYDENGNTGMVPTPKPHQLTTNEVEEVVGQFIQAAKNAIEAGFDGIEIHAANGYLHEQFLNPKVNDRTDKYSAKTLDNRIRFTMEVIDGISSAIGSNKVGIRLSPYGQLFGMPLYPEIDETYLALAQAISERSLAYIHLMNQNGFTRIDDSMGDLDPHKFTDLVVKTKNTLSNTALILAGGMTKKTAEDMIDDNIIDLAAFGVPYISNPDLVARLKNNWPLNEADRTTFYGSHQTGYVDYPAHSK